MTDNQENQPVLEDETSGEATKNDKFTSSDVFDIFQVLLQSIVIIAIIFVVFFRFSNVNGDSMNPTLKSRDTLVLTNIGFKCQRGDIVVVSQPNYLNEVLIKRIIGLPGETIDINRDGKVTINGEVLEENYTAADILSQKKGDIELPHTVPDGHVFVMGDNRNASTDSRYRGVGDIDTRYIVGEAKFRVFPFGDNYIGKNIDYNLGN